jgi:hypothetical protein
MHRADAPSRCSRAASGSAPTLISRACRAGPPVTARRTCPIGSRGRSGRPSGKRRSRSGSPGQVHREARARPTSDASCLCASRLSGAASRGAPTRDPRAYRAGPAVTAPRTCPIRSRGRSGWRSGKRWLPSGSPGQVQRPAVNLSFTIGRYRVSARWSMRPWEYAPPSGAVAHGLPGSHGPSGAGVERRRLNPRLTSRRAGVPSGVAAALAFGPIAARSTGQP